MVFDLEQSKHLVPSSHLTYLFLLGLISFAVILMVKFVGIVFGFIFTFSTSSYSCKADQKKSNNKSFMVLFWQ